MRAMQTQCQTLGCLETQGGEGISVEHRPPVPPESGGVPTDTGRGISGGDGAGEHL